jgi:hypothetical protein
MNGETNINTLIKNMTPALNPGEYVFCQTADIANIDVNEMVCIFKEAAAFTLVMKKATADKLQLHYDYTAAWITLTVQSSLEAVGLTAAFSKALADAGISCNVIAAFYHDHIFVNVKDADKAMSVLRNLSANA